MYVEEPYGSGNNWQSEEYHELWKKDLILFIYERKYLHANGFERTIIVGGFHICQWYVFIHCTEKVFVC